MRTFYRIVSLSLLFGVVHSALTPVFYKEPTEDSFWFFATGLTLVFSGMMNLFALSANQNWIYNICIISNVIMLIWVSALTVLLNGALNAVVVIFMYLGVLLGSIFFRINPMLLGKSKKYEIF